MTVYFLNVIIILFVTIICPSDSLFCSYGERFSLCDKNKCEPTCEHPQGPRFCDHKCRPGCVCNSGLVRRETDNKCVPIEECPKMPSKERPQNPKGPDKEPKSLFCPYRERFSLCGNHNCKATCEHPQGPLFCEPKCKPGCVCNSGLVRRETDNKCVPVEECPKKPSKEKPQKPRIPDKEPRPDQQKEGGKRPRPENLRDSWSTSKVKVVGCNPQKCGKKSPVTLKVCPEEETFSLCGNHQCQPTCKNPAGPLGCEPTCRPGCVCKSGLVRREWDNECVPLEKCPRKGLRAPRPWRKRRICDSYIDIGPCKPYVPQIPWGR